MAIDLKLTGGKRISEYTELTKVASGSDKFISEQADGTGEKLYSLDTLKTFMNNGMQESLTEAQQAAVNSGITEALTERLNVYTKMPSAMAFNSRIDRNWDGLGALADKATDVTADFDNGTLSRKIAANDLSDYDLGMQIKKTITIDSVSYTAHIIFAHANAFYGYLNYAMVNTPNIACIVYVEGYISKWNDSSTSGGYTSSALRTVIQKVVTALKTALGSSHMVSHNVLLANAVTNGKSSSWAWVNDSYGEALSAAQVCGVNPSGSYFDMGEAYEQLALPRLVRPNQIFGNVWLWFRDVLAASVAAALGNYGDLGDGSVSATCHVVPLILLK